MQDIVLRVSGIRYRCMMSSLNSSVIDIEHHPRLIAQCMHQRSETVYTVSPIDCSPHIAEMHQYRQTGKDAIQFGSRL